MPAKKIPSDRLIQIVKPIRVKYKDVFSIKAFYEALHEWLLEYEWKDLEEGSDKYERFYGERVRQDRSKEIWIRWRTCKKAPDADYLTYYLDFDFHSPAIVTMEVIKEGKKLKTNKGELELTLRAFIEENYKETMEGHPFLKHFKDLFAKRIYNKTIVERKKELYREVYALQTFIKQWFKLKRYQPYEDTKTLFASEAYPSHLKEK